MFSAFSSSHLLLLLLTHRQIMEADFYHFHTENIQQEYCNENSDIHLHAAILRNLKYFSFLLAPESLMQALEDLDYLAALDNDGNLSEFGIIMSEFPLDPQLSKSILASCEFECVDEMLTIAAMVTGTPNSGLTAWLGPPAKNTSTFSKSVHGGNPKANLYCSHPAFSSK